MDRPCGLRPATVPGSRPKGGNRSTFGAARTKMSASNRMSFRRVPSEPLGSRPASVLRRLLPDGTRCLRVDGSLLRPRPIVRSERPAFLSVR